MTFERFAWRVLRADKFARRRREIGLRYDGRPDASLCRVIRSRRLTPDTPDGPNHTLNRLTVASEEDGRRCAMPRNVRTGAVHHVSEVQARQYTFDQPVTEFPPREAVRNNEPDVTRGLVS